MDIEKLFGGHARRRTGFRCKIWTGLVGFVLLLIFLLKQVILEDVNTHPISSQQLDNGHEHCSITRPYSWKMTSTLSSWVEESQIGPDSRMLPTLWTDLSTLFQANPPQRRMYLLSKPIRDFLRMKTKVKTPLQADEAFGISAHDAMLTRQAHQNIANSLESFPYKSLEESYRGKGIVILAGGSFIANAATALNALRQLGSNLPVEIWGIDANEENIDWSAEIRSQGAVYRRISDYADTKSWIDQFNPLTYTHFGAFNQKILAVLFSSFEEVLLLDADNTPAEDPSRLFTDSAYEDTGAVIWPDYWKSISTTWLPFMLGIETEKSQIMWHQSTAESGQLLWDKRRHWKSLLMACYYNFYGPTFWYDAITGEGAGWGDKDTYLVALQAAGEPYHMIDTRPLAVDALNTSNSPTIITMQLPPEGSRPPFYASDDHPTAASGISQGSTVDSSEPLPAFLHGCGAFKWSLPNILGTYSPRSLSHFIMVNFDAKYALAHDLLRSRKRIISLDVVSKKWPNWDPELFLWRSVETTACYSRALGSAKSCRWVRDYIAHVFGKEVGRTGSAHACGDS